MRKYLSLPRFMLFLFLNLFLITPVQTLIFLKRKQFDLMPSYYKGILHGLIGKYGMAFFE